MVYLLMVLDEEECIFYRVYSVYNSREKAKEEIKRQGGNKNENGIPLWVIDEWKVW